MKMKWKGIAAGLLALACGAVFLTAGRTSASAESGTVGEGGSAAFTEPDLSTGATPRSSGGGNAWGGGSDSSGASPDLSGTELFTQRDLEQTPDMSGAKILTVSDGETLSIPEEGVYILRGTAQNATVLVEADKSAKVQLVLDGLHIENESFPCIYVRSADKVFVTTLTDSSLAVTGSFVSDGEGNLDGVIFSRDDLVLNGCAVLSIRSSENGVVSKDDLKVTGGSYQITAGTKCLEAKDSIRICGGSFTLEAGTDALHAENDEDESLGWICITGGSFRIDAGDDGIHANAFLQIDGGSFSIDAAEGLESTYVRINDGELSIDSWDDGINAARKSSVYAPFVEINGGSLTITMAAGDTDGIDSNGSIAVNGGTVSISGSSSFDYEGSGTLNGGTVLVNGQQLDYLPNQMMGGGMGGQPGQGGMGGRPGRRG